MFETFPLTKIDFGFTIKDKDIWRYIHTTIDGRIYIFRYTCDYAGKKFTPSGIFFFHELLLMKDFIECGLYNIEEINVIHHVNNNTKWVMSKIIEIQLLYDRRNKDSLYKYIVENGDQYIEPVLIRNKGNLEIVKIIYYSE